MESSEHGIVLNATGISKAFGSTQALDDISIEIYSGEIHGLIGENGSGKSTLSSIIAGAKEQDTGKMYLMGEEYKPENILDAISKGVTMIVQEQGTLSNISVAANMFLGKEDKFSKAKIMNLNKLYAETRKALSIVDAQDIDPRRTISSISLEARKLVEIARAVYSDPKILIVDETTNVLPIREREMLYSLMRKLCDDGKAVVFISHDIDEIIEQCDRVTILRDGKITGKLKRNEFEISRMKQLMVGRVVSETQYNKHTENLAEEVELSIEGINTKLLQSVSFQLHKGEILGIGGLSDCGMHDIGRVVFGLIKPTTGDVRLSDGTCVKGTSDAVQHKIGYVSKDRDQEALMLNGSVRDNICLPSLKKLSKVGLISKRVEKNFAENWVDKLSIKTSSIKLFCSSLSGGNKQKVSLARWLANDSDILILDCPTRGIDIGVKDDIYKIVMHLKEMGKSILLISEELSELILLSDSLITLKRGAISGRFYRKDGLEESKIIQYII